MEKIITKIVVLDNNYNNYTRSEKEYVVFPFYHPASVFYNSSLKELYLKIGKIYLDISNFKYKYNVCKSFY